MTGYWLSRSNTIFATQKNPYSTDRLLASCERRGEGKKKEYFIPITECTEEFKAKNIPTELDVDEILTELEENVDFNQQSNNALNDELKRARIEKLKIDTKHINEKLDFRKRELFTEWSEKFFDVFADSFGKLKNVLVSLHLNEEQLNLFNQTLDSCIHNLELHLDETWTEFNNEVIDEKED